MESKYKRNAEETTAQADDHSMLFAGKFHPKIQGFIPN